MLLSRRLRRTFAWLLVASLLFAQSAAVALACSRVDAASAAVAAKPCSAHLAADDPARVLGDSPFAQGNVCEVHCQTASPPTGGTLDLPPVVVVARWEVPALPLATGTPAPTPELEARSAAPPLLALLPRLLI